MKNLTVAPPAHSNAEFAYERAVVAAVEAVEAPDVVTSGWMDQQLAEVYDRVGLRPGMLFRLAGIDERRWWPRETTFEDAAAQAGRKVLDAAHIDPSDVDLLISSSVSRHHLEPSVAAQVHHRLGLAPECLNFDVSNACLGFLNAIQIAASAIDTGTIETALIVNAEGSRQLQEATLDRLRSTAACADDVFTEFASLTLGSGAAAMILTRDANDGDGHRVRGGVARSGTEHHRLCVGSLHEMQTDSGGLLNAGIALVEDTWSDAVAGPHTHWPDADHFIIHQVSKVHTRLVTERLGIQSDKMPLTFPTFGNVGPAAIPITLAAHASEIAPGDTVLCMGVGSGLNTCYLEIGW